MDYLPRPIPILPVGGIAAEIRFTDEFVLANDHKDDVSHLHDCCEVYVNLSGDVSFAIGSHVYPVAPGDVIITRPNELHHCIYHSDCRHGHYCLGMRPAAAADDSTVFLVGDGGDGAGIDDIAVTDFIKMTDFMATVAQNLLHCLGFVLIDLASKGIKGKFHVISTKIKRVKL